MKGPVFSLFSFLNDYTTELLAHSSVVNLEDLPANLFKTDK